MIPDATPNAILVADAAGVIASVPLSGGRGTIVAFTGVPLVDIAMAPNGELWGTDGAGLFRVNRQSGRAFAVPGREPASIMGMSFDPDGVLHAIDPDARPFTLALDDGAAPIAAPVPGWRRHQMNDAALVEIDPVSGAELGRRPLAHAYAALANPGGDGALYGVIGSEVHRISLNSGAVEKIADVRALGLGDLRGATATLESALTTARPRFSPEFYLRRNPDVAAAGSDPRRHFEAFGWIERRAPSAKFTTFDPIYIAARHPDAIPAGLDPWPYFLEEGWRLGISPSADFDIARYLADYPDVAAAGINPLMHYLLHGIHEGRAVGFSEWASAGDE